LVNEECTDTCKITPCTATGTEQEHQKFGRYLKPETLAHFFFLFITANALTRPVACYLSTAHALINGIRSTPMFRGEDSLINKSINCYVNAKVYFKMACVRVRVRIRAYPHFPTTPPSENKIDHVTMQKGGVNILLL